MGRVKVGEHHFFCYLTYDCYHSKNKKRTGAVTLKLTHFDCSSHIELTTPTYQYCNLKTT